MGHLTGLVLKNSKRDSAYYSIKKYKRAKRAEKLRFFDILFISRTALRAISEVYSLDFIGVQIGEYFGFASAASEKIDI